MKENIGNASENIVNNAIVDGPWTVVKKPKTQRNGKELETNGGDGGPMDHSNRALVNLNDIKVIVGNMGSRFIMLNDEC